RLMLYLILFRREARDWVDNTRIGYDKSGIPIATGFEPQWHHIFPRSVLAKFRNKSNDIHALANITVINERTNVNKLSGKEPAKYIEHFHISEQNLRSHLIPESFARAVHNLAELKKQWDVQQYDQFLLERAQLLAQEANAFLQSLEGA
ncbi:MAG: hypothetical protein J7454_13055, partial [Roseiflexus sp.]|nr:hypothetical protein [Roseiflexus sp.]